MKTKVEIFKDGAGDFRLRATAEENGNILTSSPEGYKNKAELISASVRASKAILEKYDPSALTQ